MAKTYDYYDQDHYVPSFMKRPDNREFDPPDMTGWKGPDGPATQAMVSWHNEKTGQRHTTNTGGWTPPSSDWVQGNPDYTYDPIDPPIRGGPADPIDPPIRGDLSDWVIKDSWPDIPLPGPVKPGPKPISPFEGYTGRDVRGFVDRNLANVTGERGIGSGFKVDSGDNYRTVDWKDKGFTAPETSPDDVPQIFWNPDTKEIVQLPTGGYAAPEGWQKYGGEYIDKIDVPDFGDEPDKIIRTKGREKISHTNEEIYFNPYWKNYYTETVSPEWTAWKQKVDEFSASLPEAPEDAPEVPTGPSYDLVWDRGAALNPDSAGSQLMKLFKGAGRKTRWDPDSKKILIDDRAIHSEGDLRDLYKETVGKTGRTLEVTRGMQAIDFYKNSILGSATGNFNLTATKKALTSIDSDTSYLDAIVHNEKMRNDASYKDNMEGNVRDAVLLTQDYIDEIKGKIPTGSAASPSRRGGRFYTGETQIPIPPSDNPDDGSV